MVKDSAIVVRDSTGEEIVSPDVAIVEPSVTDGSGSDGYNSSAKSLLGFVCWVSQGKIALGFSVLGAGFSLGTSYHMFLGGLG